ncbi:hypothetical protein BgiBS90_000185 [Biomphalaria glabrata]|nr:hypothetical protein BgiBS90_000185 [Biomphalaria glabrata]
MGFTRLMIKLKMYKSHLKEIFFTFLLIITLFIFFKTYFDQALSYSPFIRSKSINTFYKLISYKNLLASKRFNSSCEIRSLRPSLIFKTLLSNNGNSCQRVDPIPGSCDVADKLFFSHPKASCTPQNKLIFCTLQNKLNKWSVTCDEKISQICSSHFYISILNQSTGSLKWQEVGTINQVAVTLSGYLEQWDEPSTPKFYGYCFIRCQLAKDLSKDDLGDDLDKKVYGEQLLVLPPQFTTSNPAHSSSQNLININIIFVDSVSHQHFFRSLKKTVATLESINTDSSLLGHVLDFRLFQAVRSRTFESLQVLFSGQIDPLAEPFGTQDLPEERLVLEALLGKFKRKGYNTLWLEDLCYLWEWGIAKDLLFMNKSSHNSDTWVRMWGRLRECDVDSIDITLSMCRILQSNNVKDHFHGPSAVCFNGRHQHEYLLDYLKLYQQRMVNNHKPFFTFTMTNVGHEDTGRRIQSLDIALASYLLESLYLKNTLTIILSDHGNSYGAFFKESLEAQLELFHPFMFFIVPKDVAELLGTSALHNLSVNTDRLISLLDLHYTLKSLVDSDASVPRAHKNYLVSPHGLFDIVSANRSCNNIPRIMPNLCICKNFEMVVENDSDYDLFAYFALGQLNNEIQRQVSKQQSVKGLDLIYNRNKQLMPGFKKCQRLVLLDAENIRKNFAEHGTEVVKMDLHVQDGHIFFVALSITHNEDLTSHAALIKYDRITPYGAFSKCADDGVDLSLCVCNLRDEKSSTEQSNYKGFDFLGDNLMPNFDVQVQVLSCEDECMQLMTFKHIKGAAIFVVNSCADRIFQLKIKLEAKDDIIYSPAPSNPVIISPEGMVNIGLLYDSTGKDWTFSLRFYCQRL